ncbi:MAG TPA: ATP synthase subunit I [Pyrinomonadaceae bacterium]|nr:ATP synthase subunit I [Pyrinomonadaceae bacterium]
MKEIADSGAPGNEMPGAEDSTDASAMARRLFRVMTWTVAAAVVVSAVWLPWRVTTGLFIGGALSLLNHHWMRTAVMAAFALSADTGARPKLKIARFIMRYLIVAVALGIASWLDLASLTAMLVGLCSFAVAALAEGFMQAYFVIIHREETK